MDDQNKYVDEKKISELTDISLATLRNWRFRRQGPPYKKISPRMIRYSLKEVRQWLESHTIKPFDEESL